MAQTDLFLFPQLQKTLQDEHAESFVNIQAGVTLGLKEIPEETFHDAFEAWKSCLQKCINAGGGDYFEEFLILVLICSINLFFYKKLVNSGMDSVYKYIYIYLDICTNSFIALYLSGNWEQREIVFI